MGSTFFRARHGASRLRGAFRLAMLPIVATTAIAACGGDFDTSRSVPPRGSVGRELYSLVCDRVAAQALREDVTAQSWHGICHPDADGKTYWSKVLVDKLVPITGPAYDVNGELVSVEQQKKNRAYFVARVETLGAHREELIGAFDAAFPDIEIAVKDLGNPDPEKTCDTPLDKRNQRARLLSELADSLARMTDLYNDGTFPLLTGALGRMMRDIEKDKGVQDALARLDARQGYRPAAAAMGLARPVVSYPRMVDLVNSLLKLIASDSDPHGEVATGAARVPVPGKAAADFQMVLRVLHEELRTATSDPAPGALSITRDSTIGRDVLSRPRTTLELARTVLLAQDAKYGLDSTIPRFIARRDGRGVAVVPPETTGKLPGPFVDANGDGLADLDALGMFVTASGVRAPTPFFTIQASDSTEVARDSFGRALKTGSTTEPLYGYIDTSRTFAASLVKDLRPLFEPDPKKGSETVMKLLAGVPVVLGKRDEAPVSSKTYPPDPSRVDAWLASRKDPPPKNLGTQPVELKYRRFDPATSPLADLVYALGQIVARPEVDDTLAVFRRLVDERPDIMARMVGIGLQLKAIADKHPEAKLPENSMLWDEVLDTVVKIAQTPGILEDLLRAFGNDKTLKLDKVFAAYIKYKDELTYDRNDVNGPVWNLTVGGKSGLMTPVDRTQPDTGKNRSALQRFMQLLHDANGLAACTKEGAVAHVRIQWPANWGPVIPFDYPTSDLTPLVCAFVGESAPPNRAKGLRQCGVLRFENVAALLLDVALSRAKFDVRDKCLAALMRSPLTALVGGVDKFLEDASGIKGFNLNPTVGGVSRMVYFETTVPPGMFPDLPAGITGDTKNANTNKFFAGVLDPVPSMVCPETPFTDPSDGKLLRLRKCTNFKDTLRGRDNNDLFPLELMDFVASVGPLAAAFADHDQPLLFVELFDTMHRHWGSPKQSKEECDPSLPKTHARWCAQDGAVSYEALLAEMLETDLFPTLYDAVRALQTIKVKHCDAFDATTKLCTRSHDVDGVQALAEAVRVLVDPKRVPGLRDRAGNTFSTRNDGTKNPQVTPLYLFIDALKAIDKVFAEHAAANPGEPARLVPWRQARSELVDQLFAVEGSGRDSAFKNKAISKILPLVLDLTRAQIASHCPDPTKECTWASKELSASVESALGGPTAASLVDLLDAIRKDDAARLEIEKLIVYLLDGASDNDAQTTTLMAAVDLLQVLDDDANLEPLYRIVSNAASQAVVDDQGKVVLRGLVDGSVEALSRIFAAARNDKGKELCSREIDPNRTIDYVLKRLLLPYGKEGKDLRTPIETIMSVIADVNRQDPTSTAKLAGADYKNIAKEIAEFSLHPSRGLPQVYEVIRLATAKQSGQ